MLRQRSGALLAFVLVLATSSYVLSAGAQVASGQAERRPNVLIFVTDDQRATGTMWVMPKTRRYFQRQGVHYPECIRGDPALLPLSRHDPHRPVRAQHQCPVEQPWRAEALRSNDAASPHAAGGRVSDGDGGQVLQPLAAWNAAAVLSPLGPRRVSARRPDGQCQRDRQNGGRLFHDAGRALRGPFPPGLRSERRGALVPLRGPARAPLSIRAGARPMPPGRSEIGGGTRLSSSPTDPTSHPTFAMSPSRLPRGEAFARASFGC